MDSMKLKRGFLSRSLLVLFLFTGSIAVAGETFQFTVVGIDCKGCAPPILKALRGVQGVQDAKLDWKAGVATVQVSEGFQKAKIKTALDVIGYEAVFPDEEQKDLKPLAEEVVKTLDIVSFDGNQKIDVKELLAAGKITILDYWAAWCSPCRFQDARLQHLVRANSNIAVRRIDVAKWNNAAARQATAEFRLAALPYVRVYDSSGRFVGAVTGGSWDKLLGLIEKAKTRG